MEKASGIKISMFLIVIYSVVYFLSKIVNIRREFESFLIREAYQECGDWW